jgi:protocatechuate 3,4-dioxygenase beta subunit
VPLTLRFRVQDAGTCQPIKGADVELWHADARGVHYYAGLTKAEDSIYGDGGQRTTLRLHRRGSGYRATLALGLS